MKKAINVIKYALLISAMLFQAEAGDVSTPMTMFWFAILFGFFSNDLVKIAK